MVPLDGPDSQQRPVMITDRICPPASVLNFHKVGRYAPPGAIYIGRGSRWGNPFTHLKNASVPKTANSRRESIQQFIDYYENSDEDRAVYMREHILDLAGKDLVCYCAPEECHGDYLMRKAREAHMAAAKKPAKRPARKVPARVRSVPEPKTEVVQTGDRITYGTTAHVRAPNGMELWLKLDLNSAVRDDETADEAYKRVSDWIEDTIVEKINEVQKGV